MLLPCLFLFRLPIASTFYSSQLESINEIIEMEGSQKRISTHFCQNKGDAASVMKEMSSRYMVNVMHPKLTNVQLTEHQVFAINLNCPDSQTILSSAAERNLFRLPFVWILFGEMNSSLEQFYFGVDSKVYLIEDNQILTIFKNHPKSERFLVHNLTDIKSKYSITNNRSDLTGTLMKTSLVVTNPDSVNHLTDYHDVHIDAITKLNYIVVNHLLDLMNASREFIVRSTWGYKNATTGKYPGLVGDLQEGLAEIGGTSSFFSIERLDVLEYIVATTPTYMKFIFRAPPLTYVTNVFTLPFDTAVWRCSFIMVAVVFICIYLIVLWEWKDRYFKEKLKKEQNVLRAGFSDVLMLEMGAITQQGTDVEPKSIAGRIVTIFTFAIMMFMYTSYSANVVALLQSSSNGIKTLEDLLTSRIKLGVDDIIYAHYYFENAQDPIRKAIYEQKVAPKGQQQNFMPIEEGIRKVQAGFFAFHVELSRGYAIMGELFQENEKCGLKEIEYVKMLEPTLTIRKHSAYKEIVKTGIRKIYESGLQKRELHKIYTRKPVCHTGGSNFGSVGLIDCYSAFLIFGIGVGISLILWIMELIIYKKLKYRTARGNVFGTTAIYICYLSYIFKLLGSSSRIH